MSDDVEQDLMVGGTSTTSITVEWVMAELMHRPDIDRKARQELAAVVGGPDTVVEESHVPRLRYLRAVIKETLRFHPVVPLLVPRVPSEPCVLVGRYLVPTGARVVTNVWAIHTDPELWDSPAEFRPERFLNEGRGAEFRYFPFGAGRRRCAGLPLVERMLPLVVATLLHAFEWRVPEGVEFDLCERPGIVLTKERPVLAVPTPRFSNPDIYGWFRAMVDTGNMQLSNDSALSFYFTAKYYAHSSIIDRSKQRNGHIILMVWIGDQWDAKEDLTTT